MLVDHQQALAWTSMESHACTSQSFQQTVVLWLINVNTPEVLNKTDGLIIKFPQKAEHCLAACQD